jgi:hypothetical protein
MDHPLNHFSAWLGQVHAEDLPASAFKLAFDLTQRADAQGKIKLRRADDAALLAQLTALGYLEEIKRGGKVVGHKILANQAKPATRPATAQKIIFPIKGQGGFTRSLARRMITHPIDIAEAMLRAELRTRHASLVGRGIDEAAIHRHMRELDGAIRAELWNLIMRRSPNGDDAA